MGDHGNRYGSIHNTEPGDLEDKSPLLLLSVPESSRQNSTLINNLQTNSKRLLSHYDVYETLFSMKNVRTFSAF